MKQLWKRAGIEIEGGWNDVSRVANYFKGDCSVHVNGFSDGGMIISDRMRQEYNPARDYLINRAIESVKGESWAGEVAGPVLSNRKEIKDFITNFYPDATNYSCGLHIHVSFDNLLAYAGVMTQGFYEHFMRAINKFGDAHEQMADAQTYWHRFLGQNSYARKAFTPLTSFGGGYKYRFINYGAFDYTDKKRTFECRAFPAFNDKAVALRAIETFLNTINEYLTCLMDKDGEEVKNNLRILRGRLSADEPLAIQYDKELANS